MADVTIRAAEESEIREARWVRRNRGGRGKGERLYEQTSDVLNSGLGTALISGDTYEEVMSAIEKLRSEALEEGVSLQTFNLKVESGTQVLIRRIQSPDNIIDEK